MNKRMLLIALALISCFCADAFAKDSAMNWFIGGSAHYNFLSEKFGSDTMKKTTLSIRPIVGREMSEKWDLGAELEVAHDFSYSWTLGIFPFARYSMFRFEKFEFLLLGQIGYAMTFYDDDFDKLHSFQIGLIPEMEYRITERVSFRVRMGGFLIEHARGGVSTTTTTMVDISFFTENLFLGVNFHFNPPESKPKKD